jgi:hypothetical protein
LHAHSTVVQMMPDWPQSASVVQGTSGLKQVPQPGDWPGAMQRSPAPEQSFWLLQPCWHDGAAQPTCGPGPPLQPA